MVRGRPKVHPEGTKFTNIHILVEYKLELDKLGTMSDTYNAVIGKLIDFYKSKHPETP